MASPTSVFGVPLEKVADAQTHIPYLLETIFQCLATVISSDPSADLSVLFSVPTSDPRVQAFIKEFDLYSSNPNENAQNPLLSLTDPLVASSIVVAFFDMLPEPLIPVQFYTIFARCAAIRDLSKRANYLRVLVRLIPAANSATLIALLKFLVLTRLDTDRLYQIFGRAIIRQENDNTQSATPDPVSVAVVKHLVLQTSFIDLTTEEPNATQNTDDSIFIPSPGDDDTFCPEVVSLAEFDSRYKERPFIREGHALLRSSSLP